MARHLGLARHAYQALEADLETGRRSVRVTPSEEVRLLRRHHGFSMDELAQQMECSRQWVWRMETGLADPRPLREFYGCR